MAGTPGHALHPAIAEALAKMPSDHLIDKPTFGSMDLAQRLRPLAEEGPLEVELVGLCTGICVLSNAILLKAAFPEAEISVDARLLCLRDAPVPRHRPGRHEALPRLRWKTRDRNPGAPDCKN